MNDLYIIFLGLISLIFVLVCIYSFITEDYGLGIMAVITFFRVLFIFSFLFAFFYYGSYFIGCCR